MDFNKVIEANKKGDWYTIPDTDVHVQIRIPTPKELRQIRRKCTVTKQTRRGPLSELDEDKLSDALLNLCIIDWKNISKDGKDFLCTEENKKFIDENWTEFSSLWNEVFTNRNEMQDRILRDQEKN